MKVYERATQIWPVLTWSATHRQTLTYGHLGRLIGVPTQGLGHLLEPIQSYCLLNDLPPLTILVVSKVTGMPGDGFIAAKDIPSSQARVFGFDWLSHTSPSPTAFEAAAKARPSRIGVPDDEAE